MLFLKKKANEFKNSRPHLTILRASYVAAAFLIICVIFSSIYIRRVIEDIPSIDKLDEYVPSLTTHIYDINNEIIADYSVEKRAMLTLDRIPVDLQNALIAMEDRDFFKHNGISFKGIVRSILVNLKNRRIVQGASTITQQLVKLLFFDSRRTFDRKIKEQFFSILVELKFTKE